MKPYYIANTEHMDAVYGDQYPICMDAREVNRLAREWGMDASELFEQLHEAGPDEIAEFGVYDTPLSDAEFYTLWGEALAATDRDAYVSDMVLSSMWGDPEDVEIPQERVDYIGRIWDVAHMTMRDICKEAHLTQKAMSTMFCIPHRTLQGWCLGERECPPYVRLMMARLLNLL